MKQLRLFRASCLALLFVVGAAPAAEPGWKAGLARVKVTPERPVMLAGYAARNHPFEKVASDLFVKALALDDGQGHRGVLVTSDLIGFSAAVAEPICERIREKTGLGRDQILINSSHIHTGPILSLTGRDGDNPRAAEAQRTIEYTRQLQDKVVDVVVQAVGKMEPVRLSWGGGIVHFAMNRREFTPNGVILGNNPRGLADRSVPVLKVEAPDGRLRAVVFGAATHNTTLGQDCYEVCGDYAGYAQAAVEDRHPGAEALFVLGCAGDSNPYPRGTMEMSRQHGAALAAEVERVLGTKLKPVNGPLSIAFGRADLPLQAVSREELQKIVANRRDARSFGAKEMLALLDKGQQPPTHYTCPETVWQFGRDLTLVGLSGEVVVDYVTRLEQALGPNNLWVAAYCNDVFGYLPSARVLREGGYETRGLYSGGAGFFAPQAEEVVVRTVRELAATAGRKVPE